jgi:hypothetical protein
MPPRLITRRRVLYAGVAAGGAVALGVGGVAWLRGIAPKVEGLRVLLLEVAPVVDEHRLVTFSHMEPALRLALFRRWLEGPDLLRRQAATAFLRFLSVSFYDRPEVWPALAYEGPLVRAPE